MTPAGRILIFLGAALILAGAGIIFTSRYPGLFGWIGHLPGDFSLQRPHFRLYFPLTTGLVFSALLSVLFWLFAKLWP